MAQTDARPGFRLPWNSERSNGEQTEMDEAVPVDETAQADETAQVDHVDGGFDSPTIGDENADVDGPEVATAETADPTDHSGRAAGPASRRPSKFMEDLSKAMQVAAEDARDRRPPPQGR